MAPADTAVLDQSADVDSNLTLTLADTVINAAEDATVGMTLTGIDPGNTVEISLAHDSDVGEDGLVDDAESGNVSLTCQSTTRATSGSPTSRASPTDRSTSTPRSPTRPGTWRM